MSQLCSELGSAHELESLRELGDLAASCQCASSGQFWGNAMEVHLE